MIALSPIECRAASMFSISQITNNEIFMIPSEYMYICSLFSQPCYMFVCLYSAHVSITENITREYDGFITTLPIPISIDERSLSCSHIGYESFIASIRITDMVSPCIPRYIIYIAQSGITW